VQAGFDLYGCEYENDLSMLVDESQVDVLTNLEQLQQLVEVSHCPPLSFFFRLLYGADSC